MSKPEQKLHHITPSGKYRNWRKHRNQALALSMAYRALGPTFQKKADRVFSCARRIDLTPPEPDSIGQTVHNRYGCKDRFCPGCQSSRGRKNFMELYQIYQLYSENNPNDTPALLTLTIPNVTSHQMRDELSALLIGFRKLTRRKAFQMAVKAWFRALEVTYNGKMQTYHPHIHVLLMLQHQYFDKTQNFYLHHKEWLALWQKIMRRPDIKHLDIRVLRPHPDATSDRVMGKAIAELAKYATKPADIFIPTRGGGYKVTPHIIEALHHTLKQRRLIAYGGPFRALRRDLPTSKFQPVEDDLLDIYLWEDETEKLPADYYLQRQQFVTNGNNSNERK